MAINVLQELERLYQATNQRSESLSERLNKLDAYSSQVDPVVRSQMLDFSNRPVGYNPLEDFQTAIEFSERSRSERAAASQDLESQQKLALSLLSELDQLQRRGGAGSDSANELAALQEIFGQSQQPTNPAVATTTPQVGPVHGPANPRTGQIAGMSPAPASGASRTANQPKQANLVGDILGGLIKPFVDTGRLVGGAGFELARAAKSAAGDRNAYFNQETRQTVKNPFLSEQELSRPGAAGLGARSALGALSFAVPFGRGTSLTSKVLAPGAGVGALQGLSEEQATPTSVAASTLGGAAGAGLLGGLGALLGKTVSGLGKAGKAARQSVLNPQAEATPFYATERAGLQQVAERLGLKGSAARQLDQLPQVFKTLDEQIKTTLSQVKKPVPIKQAVKDFDQALEASNFLPGESVYEQAKKIFLNRLEKVAAKGQASANNLYELKSALRNELSGVFTKLSRGTALTPKEEVRHALYTGLKNTLDRVAPKVRELNNLEHGLFDLSKGLVKSSKSNLGIPVVGNLPGVTPAVQEVVDTTGRAAQKTSGALAGLTTRPNQLSLLLAALSGGNIGRGVASTTPQPQGGTDQQNYADNLQIGDEQPDQQLDHGASIPQRLITPEQVMAVLMNPDISTKTKQAIKDAYEIQESAVKVGELSAHQEKELGKLDSAQIIADEVSKAYAKLGPTGRITGLIQLGTGKIGINPAVTAYESLRRASIGPLARAISGEVGVMTDQDIARAEELLPRVIDTPAEAKLKLEQLNRTIALKRQAGKKRHGSLEK